MAPNHKCTWPWRLTRPGAQTREALVPITLELKQKKKGKVFDEPMRAALRQKVLNPAEMIVVSIVRTDNAFQYREDYAAASCAIQNMMLAAVAEGFGSKWSTGGPTRDPRSYEVLQINPEQEEIIGFLFLGKPGRVPVIERPPLSQHLRRLP
jgi:nitroreductase